MVSVLLRLLLLNYFFTSKTYVMLRHLTLITILCFFCLNSTRAQNVTRLTGYQEIYKDTLGNKFHYHAYWHKFSNNRKTIIGHFFYGGWTYYGMFKEESAPDTSWAITEHYGTGAYMDSGITVHVYDSVNNTHKTTIYGWDTSALSWKLLLIRKDSFVNTSGRLTSSYQFEYDTANASYNNVGNHVYTYTTGGMLSEDIKTYWSTVTNSFETEKWEYTWSGNNMIGQNVYNLTGGVWQLHDEQNTVYANGKPFTHNHTFWAYHNGNKYVSGRTLDSNIYNGNTLITRYHAGFPSYLYDGRSNYSYDIDGNVKEVVSQALQGGNWVNTSKKEISYNAYDNPVEVKEFLWFNNQWKPSWTAPTRLYHYQTPTAVNDVQSNTSLILYPSPASDVIHMKTEFKEMQEYTIAIIDAQGMLRMQWSDHIKSGSAVTSIPISNLPPGNYWLRLYSSDENIVKGFTVVK